MNEDAGAFKCPDIPSEVTIRVDKEVHEALKSAKRRGTLNNVIRKLLGMPFNLARPGRKKSLR